MSSAQDRSSGLQTGAQAGENAAGSTGPGTTSGAAATGPATGTTTTGTTSGMAEQSGGQMSGTSRHARGTEPATSYYPPETYETRAGGAMGGSLAILAGLVAFLGGLAVVVRPHFYPTLSGYAYQWNGRGWGWIMLVLGVLLFAAGASALLGISAARPVGVGLAVLTAIAGFLFLVYTPVWGIVIVALSVFAIWGLIRDGTARV
jgi:hypothetical protein